MKRILPNPGDRAGFTIIELLVTIAVISLLVALLVSVVLNARESSQRATCKSNLKQIGIAIQNYESTHGRYPAGCLHTASGGYGNSFWVGLLPYLNQVAIHRSWDINSEQIGDVTQNANNGALANGKVFSVMLCPASPLPSLGNSLSNAPDGVCIPTYAGNAGTMGTKKKPVTFGLHTENRGRTNSNGTIGTGGFFVHSVFRRSKDLKDETSRVIMLGEQSDWCMDTSNGKARFDCRSSGPGNPQIVDASEQDIGQGWPIGTRFDFTSIGSPGDAQFSLTTTQYQPGTKQLDRQRGLAVGINVAATKTPNSGSGVNFPYQSVHPKGTHFLLADCTVKLFSNEITNSVLQNLLCVDDENVNICNDF